MNIRVNVHMGIGSTVAAKFVSDTNGNRVVLEADNAVIFFNCAHQLQDLINAAQAALDQMMDAQIKLLDELP